jgi:hypothetical protein
VAEVEERLAGMPRLRAAPHREETPGAAALPGLVEDNAAAAVAEACS